MCDNSRGEFASFVHEYQKRKTVPKDEAISLMISLVEDCEVLKHHAACYVLGDIPTELSPEHKKENEVIERINKELSSKVKYIKECAKTFK